MNKIGSHYQAVRELGDYQFGWESAERGEPRPEWDAQWPADKDRLRAQRFGWDEFYEEERRP